MPTRGTSSIAAALVLFALPLLGQDRFALNLFRELRSQPGNLVVAPANVATLLTLVRRGAGGTTARELDAALHGTSVKRDANVEEVVALWVDGGVRVTPPYAAAVRAVGGSVEPVSFANPEAARARINEWAKRATSGRIAEVVGPEILSRDTRAVATAAMHLKAKWESPFDRRDTRDLPFHLADGRDVRTPTMRQTLSARFGAVHGARLLELPYSTGMTMLIVLPDRSDGLPGVERSLTPAVLAKWTAALAPQDENELQLPRFHASTEFDLRDSLKRLGVHRLFDPRGAQLPGLQSSRPLAVAHVGQSIVIDVDEEGTVASAASFTDTIVTGTALPPPPRPFHADHPFLYIIRSGKRILFLGRVTSPKG